MRKLLTLLFLLPVFVFAQTGTPRSISYLESKFQTGDKPSQADFYDLFASYLHYTAASGYQPLDGDLTAVAALSTFGIAVRTAGNTWTTRTLTAGGGISISNGDGVAGNPTISTSLAATQVGFGSGTGTLTGSPSFVYNDAANFKTIAVGNNLTNNGNFGSAMFGELGTIATNVGAAFYCGEQGYIGAYGGHNMGRTVRVTGTYSWGGGWYSPGTPTNAQTFAKAVIVSGNGSFGYYETNGSQTDEHGVLAASSAVLGGLNPNIPATSVRTVILGGNGIKARASDPDQVYVPTLNINTAPELNDTINQVLVRDFTTGEVKRRSSASFLQQGSNTITEALTFQSTGAIPLIFEVTDGTANHQSGFSATQTSVSIFEGVTGSRRSVNINASDQGISIDDQEHSKGLVGGADYSANYDANTYVQKVYVDQAIQSAVVEISSAEILAINTTPKVLVPAPGAGKFIQVISIMGSLDFVSAAYATNFQLEFRYNAVSASLTSAAWNIAQAEDKIFRFQLNSNTTGEANTSIINQPVTLNEPTGNPVTGDGTLKAYITYRVVDL